MKISLGGGIEVKVTARESPHPDRGPGGGDGDAPDETTSLLPVAPPRADPVALSDPERLAGEPGYVSSEPVAGTILSSCINLTNTILGSGMLVMPAALDAVGILPGIFFMLLSALLSIHGLVLLARCGARLPPATRRHAGFGAVAEVSHPSLAVWFDAAVAVKCFGVAVSYLVIIRDLAPRVVEAIWADASGWEVSRVFWVTAVVVIVAPFVFRRNLDSLRFTSALALGAVAYLLLVVVGFYIWPAEEMLPRPGKEDLHWVKIDGGLLRTLPIFVFAFGCHQNIFPIHNELADSTLARVSSVATLSVGAAFVVYQIIGVFGYLSFGHGVASNIIEQYPAGRIITIGQFALCILFLFSYPLQTHPARACISSIVSHFYPSAALPTSSSSSTAPNTMSRPRHMIITLFLLVSTYGVAVTVPDLTTVLALVGATGHATICYILPGVMYIGMRRKQDMVVGWRDWDMIGALALASFGAALMVLSVGSQLAELGKGPAVHCDDNDMAPADDLGARGAARKVLDSLDSKARADLLELLLSEAASKSTLLTSTAASVSAPPDDPWLGVLVAVDRLQSAHPVFAAAAASSPRQLLLRPSSNATSPASRATSPSPPNVHRAGSGGVPMGLTSSTYSALSFVGGTGELLFIRAPDDMNAVVEILRDLQRNPHARALFDGIDVPLEVRDTKSRSGGRPTNTRPTSNLFALIESHIVTMLLLAPSVILRSASNSVTKRPHNASNLPSATLALLRSTSANSTLSTDSAGSSLGPVDDHPATPPHNPALPLTPVTSPSPAPSSPQHQPASSSTPASLRRILASSTLLYSIVEGLVSAHADRLLETESLDLDRYSSLSDKMAEGIQSVVAAVKRIKGWETGKVVVKGDPAGVYSGLLGGVETFVRCLMAYVEFVIEVLPAPAQPVVAVTFAEGEKGDRETNVGVVERRRRSSVPGNVVSAVGDSERERKTMSRRIKAFFLEEKRASHMSTSSASSDDSINKIEKPTADRKRRKNSDVNLQTSKVSADEAPRLPEVSRNYHVLDRLPRQMSRSMSQGEAAHAQRISANPQILQRPASQRLRVVSVLQGKDDWRLRLPTEEDWSDHPDPSSVSSVPSSPTYLTPASAVTSRSATSKRKDRWSQLLDEVTATSTEALGGLDRVDPAVMMMIRSASNASAVVHATPPLSPLRLESHQPGLLPQDVDDDERIPLSTLRRHLNATALPQQDEVGRLSLDAPSSKGSSMGGPLGTRGAESDLESGGGMSDADGTGSAATGRASRATFDSLKVVGRRGGQRIPTFDSRGRKIGVLDHGRFESNASAGAGGRGVEDDFDQGTGGGGSSSGSISVKGNLLYLNEDGADVLVMEMLSGRLQIVAGTLEKLLFRLADENIQDMEFVDCLILCHSFFISSLDLLDNLIMRYNVRAPENPSQDELEYYAKWRRPIQMKVLTVIGRWVKLMFEDFAADPSLRERVEIFLGDVAMDGYKNESDRIRRTAAVQAASIATRTQNAPHPIQSLYHDHDADDEADDAEDETQSPSSPSRRRAAKVPQALPFPEAPLPPATSRTSSSSQAELGRILLYDARDLARYLTVADQQGFLSLAGVDYLAKLSGSDVLGVGSLLVGSSAKVGRKVDLFAARANSLRNWVALEVCSVRALKQRRKVVERFIHVAKHCREHNNFHTSLFIVSGLLSPAVQRLKKTWEGIASKDLSYLRGLEQLLDPSANMRILRKAQSTSSTPSLPFFPLVMKDLTFLNDGNAATSSATDSTISADPTVSTSSSGSSGNAKSIPLINFEKYRGLVSMLAKYVQPASDPYEFGAAILPLVRGLPACLANTGTHPWLGGQMEKGGVDLAGRTAYWEQLVAFAEGRLEAAKDDGAMGRAWSIAAAVDGEDIS
ncbi:hypothetical protein HK101_010204 [Irineochytrium annulatum]|nr:hypothetical protein HK101_010204 [Irineochytrium annulatum]